jgi:RND family efflux transporter MFP subunit
MSRRKAIIIAVLVAASGVVAWQVLGKSEDKAPAKAARPPVPVEVETVRSQDMPKLAASMGTVQSLHDVTVRAQVEGMLTEVHFREGQTVKRGELLARIDDRVIAADVAQATAEKRRNEAQLTSARIDLGRYTNLLKEEAISKQAIDQQAALVEQLEATIAANDAAIASANARLSYTRILSPVEGRVGLRRVDPGNLVRPSDPEGLVSVTQLDPIAVMFVLPQDDLAVIQNVLREHPDAPVLAFDRPGGTVLGKGKLTMIDNQIDRTTGTIQIKAQLPNLEQKLWPGQSVAVELQTGFSAQATVVSSKTVQRGMKGPFVYRLKDNKAELVTVRVGHELEGSVVILDGLSPGDVVVSDGHSRVAPGAALKVLTKTATESVAKGG